MSMEALYQAAGISRQAFHQYRRQQQQEEVLIDELIVQANRIRKNHPGMGPRVIHLKFRQEPEKWPISRLPGRDKTEAILLQNGFRTRKVVVFHKTTQPGSYRFPNRIEGMEINQINRIWMSDITYFSMDGKWFYLTEIIDLYSRKCLGIAWSRNLTAEETVIPALKMAIKNRKGHDLSRCILHSDAGGQYIDKVVLEILRKKNIKSSMAKSVYENPFIERLHSTLKNQYLTLWELNSFEQLGRFILRFLDLYNNDRPHQSLRYLTPNAFEIAIQNIPLNQRTMLTIKKIDP